MFARFHAALTASDSSFSPAQTKSHIGDGSILISVSIENQNWAKAHEQHNPSVPGWMGGGTRDTPSLVVLFVIKFFARHAIKGLAVFGSAAYLAPMATRGP
jgi:hypothetical protein